jgi:hypothetical protein
MELGHRLDLQGVELGVKGGGGGVTKSKLGRTPHDPMRRGADINTYKRSAKRST